ncbi:MAG: prepilin-type N-terminal cleavage/methylation domain-containing protein [Puniceicoccaceae bacterium]|nr:prepilin-type N-terminal cleavage/methylation domain-containing protein [Puniceicoccaceae bacterium]
MKSLHNKRRLLSKNAFTLIEIMVATVIMVILVGLVIQITSEVLKVWNRSSGKLAANAEARIALDLLTQDLETAVFRNNSQQWLRVESPVGVAADAPYASQTVALKLFSPALDRDVGPGDICAIAYRLEFKESYEDGPDVYALYRALENPEDTFNNLMGSTSQGTNSPQSLLTTDAPGNTDFWGEGAIVTAGNFLASNVVDFKVLIYGETGVANPEPLNDTDADGIPDTDYAYGGSGGVDTPLLYAEIILTVLSDEGIEILERGNLAGTGLADEDAVIRQHGEIFTRRVNFLARPL